MMDLLNWISRNALVAFFIGVFILAAFASLANFVVSAIRAATGHYPPPSARDHGEGSGEEDEDGEGA